MKRGTIVLTPFPFTDLSGQKVRPAVVVSRSDRPGNDVLLAFVTTQRSPVPFPTDLVVEMTHADFAKTGFKASSVLKLEKLVTIDASIILGELGELSANLIQQADEKLRYALAL